MHTGIFVCFVHVQMPLHGSVRETSPGVLRLGMRSGLCLAAWERRRGLLLDSLEMAWGWACCGCSHTNSMESRLGAYHRPPEAPVRTASHKGCWKGNGVLKTPSHMVSPGTTLTDFPSLGTRSCSSPEGCSCQVPSTGR